MSTRCLLATLCLLSTAVSSGAQDSARDAGREARSAGERTRLFEPAGKYALEIDGEAVPDAGIYLSLSRGSALLIETPELPAPLLLRPDEQRLDRLRPADLVPLEDGAVDLVSGAELEPVGTYAIDGASIAWTLDDRQARLTERPLLGLHGAAALAAWDPEYARRASRYPPSRAILESLRAAGAVRVRVYFGSWCPRCAQAVPRLMRLANELEDSGMRFEFFGMPRVELDASDGFWRTAKQARIYRDDVETVPLVVVYRGEKRAGRITGGWGNPERELEKVLSSGDRD